MAKRHAKRTLGHQRKSRNALGRKLVDYLNTGAEAANVGIVIQALGSWLPAFAAFVAMTPLSYFMLIGDPAIYFLRALIRLTKLVGKRFFHIEFEEEKHGQPHPWQTAGNLFTLCCFILAITLFSGALIAPPVGITLAWTAGLLGQCSVGFFDYIWPERQARRNWKMLQNNPSSTPEDKNEAEREYQAIRKSRRSFMLLLVGLTVLLICGSAAAFAPPLIVPTLLMASKVASLSLGMLAGFRLFHWSKQRWRQHQQEKTVTNQSKSEIEMQVMVAQALRPSPSPSPSPSLNSEVWSENKKNFLPSSPGKAGHFSSINKALQMMEAQPLRSVPVPFPLKECAVH